LPLAVIQEPNGDVAWAACSTGLIGAGGLAAPTAGAEAATAHAALNTAVRRSKDECKSM